MRIFVIELELIIDQSPSIMKKANRLQHESSPYLLQHAHNPVDWYPWGDEAFEKAKSENKPILVSIGYSTCHWCHVMERESFENEGVAAFMNENFINIKVDREERPDVDSIYMEAVQMVSGGHGGWPLNCFLLPDGRPFFGGTYFPPRPVQGRPAWSQVLQNISRAYKERPHEVTAQADKLMTYLTQSEGQFISELEDLAEGEALVNADDLQETYYALREGFDRAEGGFGHAPKFPSVMALRYCLNYFHFSKQMEAMEQLQLSLDAMIYGGIYDQIRGGFARYAVDREWLIPHFEKMLYDNALLIGLLADSYKISRKPLYKETIEETTAWIEAEMLSPEGGFYTALDADSEGEEGKFYVWTKGEIAKALAAFSEEDRAHYYRYYDVSEEGNWEGKTILNRNQSLEGYCKDHQLDAEAFQQKLKEMNAALLELRAERIRPGLDDKMILAWNALTCTAYSKAFQALGDLHYLEIAEQNMSFMLEKFNPEGAQLLHTYKDNEAKYNAFLDDYALLIEALLSLYESTFKKEYLRKADELMRYAIEQFFDPVDQLFFYTAEHQKDIVLRKKDMYDSAMPSGNSTMVHNLLYLGVLMDRLEYREYAGNSIKAMKKSIMRYPQSFGRWANALFSFAQAPKEIAVVGPKFWEFTRALQSFFIPHSVYCAAASADAEYPLLAARAADGKTAIYICENYSCQLPLYQLEDAVERLI
jgi:uncharacterized protein YyaL (SSP411 family)